MQDFIPNKISFMHSLHRKNEKILITKEEVERRGPLAATSNLLNNHRIFIRYNFPLFEK
jgi:hypothetical protein